MLHPGPTCGVPASSATRAPGVSSRCDAVASTARRGAHYGELPIGRGELRAHHVCDKIGCATQEQAVSKAIEVLRHEHDAILMALDILDRIVDEAKHGKIESGDAVSFVGFLKEFADKCHHGKEEGLLFPGMIGAGTPSEGGPISVMLEEHERGRALVAAMGGASDPVLRPEAFGDAAAAYMAHLRMHIEKENTVLFPLAERI